MALFVNQGVPTLFFRRASYERAGLTRAALDAQREARQKATAEGKKGKELRQEVDAALNLTEEQKKAQQDQAKEAGELRANLKKALAGVLNEEQVNQLGLGGGRGKKKNR